MVNNMIKVISIFDKTYISKVDFEQMIKITIQIEKHL